jgi:hypothetical protein
MQYYSLTRLWYLMTFSHFVLILRTFSGSAAINKILNVKIFEIIYLKSKNLKTLQRREKFKNWWKPRSFLLQASPLLWRRYPIIDNISISHWWNIMFPHFCDKKKSSTKCCKRSHYVRGLKCRNFTKEVAYIYCWNLINYIIWQDFEK